MPLMGRAFLAIWHDIAPDGEREYEEWHTRQHMPERLGVPGFLLGRRYVDRDAPLHRWLTLYETRTLEVLSSEGYRARLNAPTHWSGRVQPHFRNFVRSACTLSASVGEGVGGALATLRLALDPAGLARLEAEAHGLAHRLASLPGVTGGHVGVAAPDTTRVRTRESELRADAGESVFDAVVMVEATGRRELREVADAATTLLGTALRVSPGALAIYDLAYVLATTDRA